MAGINEQRWTQERIANVIAALFWLDDDQVVARYGAIGSPYVMFATNHDVSSDLIFSQSNFNCTGAESVGEKGRAFEQAMWELMFNRNCDTSACYDTDGFGNDIWIGLNREQVLTRVGDALAFALKVEGGSPTIRGLSHRMVQRVLSNSGVAVYYRMRAIMIHHQLL